MNTKTREFRTTESLGAEKKARGAVKRFLKKHGFLDIRETIKQTGTATSQIVDARMSTGEIVKMRVRLCWRPRRKIGDQIAAAQLRARLVNGSWEETMNALYSRDVAHGVTHTLIVHFNGYAFQRAALIPRDAMTDIWRAQSEISDKLIREKKMGRIKKNHARNGSSPTIWLKDSRTKDAQQVADVLWDHPEVIDIFKLDSARSATSLVDCADDCPVDLSLIGRDATTPVAQSRIGYPRNGRVRKKVLERAAGQCERQGCPERRAFSGFLDVHHILGVAQSDRVWNCVALCPNCHREAHYSPECQVINTELSKHAAQYRPLKKTIR